MAGQPGVLETRAAPEQGVVLTADERTARLVHVAGYVVFAAATLGIPWILTSIYDLNIFVEMAINATLATGLAIIVRAGRMSLAQASFGGIGGYTSGILVMQLGWNYWPALVAAGLMAGLVGILLGLASFRLQGFFFAIATFAFSMIAIVVLGSWTSVTGGLSGMFGLPFPPPIGPFKFANPRVYYFFALFIALLSIILYYYCSAGTRFGKALTVLGEDEVLGGAMGVPAKPYRLSAFAISSFVGGIAGSLQAHFIQGISPSDIAPEISIFVLVMVMAGGVRTLVGPALGAAILTLIPELLRASAEWSLVFYGAFLLIYVYLFRGGLLPLIDRSAFALCRRIRPGAPIAPQAPAAAGVEAITPLPSSLMRHSSAAPDDILVLDHVRCAFGDMVVFSDLSLVVPRGELRGIIGPNGAGKTTLFNIITGNAPMSAGRMTLSGRIIRPTPAVMARSGVARTFQHPRVLESRTVEASLDLAAELSGRNANRRYMSWVVDVAGLRPLLKVKGAELSHYQRRLLTVAIAIATQPDVLLLDEPLAGLDETETVLVKERIRAIHHQLGCTVLLIEHKLSVVMELCSRITVLDFGRVIADGDPTSVSRDAAVLQAYMG